jgi:hypothetical protein
VKLYSVAGIGGDEFVCFPFDMKYLSEEEMKKFLEIGQRILDIHKGEGFVN